MIQTSGHPICDIPGHTEPAVIAVHTRFGRDRLSETTYLGICPEAIHRIHGYVVNGPVSVTPVAYTLGLDSDQKLTEPKSCQSCQKPVRIIPDNDYSIVNVPDNTPHTCF